MKTVDEILELADNYATAIAQQGEAHDHIARDALKSAIEELVVHRADYNKLTAERGEGKAYYEAYIEGCNESFNAMMQELEKAREENEAVRRANSDCVDNFNQMSDELALEKINTECFLTGARNIHEKLREKIKELESDCLCKRPDRYSSTPVFTSNCNRHPAAPHGIDDIASYYAGHPVCTCQSWQSGEAS